MAKLSNRHFFGAREATAINTKLCEFSVIYWSYLLNWIDFKGEIGDYVGLIGSLTTRKAKYLNLINVFGKRS
ncbi:MAG: hypothetical protein LJE92_14665 [Gammaproteobacteria bacterium]|jgi:hypothetical protein|nr:hypothetical protein [Gammaproteobacteria bacterium]